MRQTASAFSYEAIPAAYLEQIRAAGRDAAGNPVTIEADADGGNPLRCCLRETLPGEKVMLIAYTPPGGTGAYAEVGPVFVHAEPCSGYRTPDAYPPGLAHRTQVVRAYDRRGRIAAGVLVNGREEAEATIGDLLTRPEVELVQIRNVGYGCYNFAVRRAGGSS